MGQHRVDTRQSRIRRVLALIASALIAVVTLPILPAAAGTAGHFHGGGDYAGGIPAPGGHNDPMVLWKVPGHSGEYGYCITAWALPPAPTLGNYKKGSLVQTTAAMQYAELLHRYGGTGASDVTLGELAILVNDKFTTNGNRVSYNYLLNGYNGMSESHALGLLEKAKKYAGRVITITGLPVNRSPFGEQSAYPLTVTVKSKQGYPIKNTRVDVSISTGPATLDKTHFTTDSDGIGHVTLTPTAPGEYFTISAKVKAPMYLQRWMPPSGVNAQQLMGLAPLGTVTKNNSRKLDPDQDTDEPEPDPEPTSAPSPSVSTSTSPGFDYSGTPVYDTVRVSGMSASDGSTATGTLSATLRGPVTTTTGSCSGVSYGGAPSHSGGSVPVSGNGTYTLGPASTSSSGVGCYSWEVSLDWHWVSKPPPPDPDDPDAPPPEPKTASGTVNAAAGDASETSLLIFPRLSTSTSAAVVDSPGPVSDRVHLSGTAGVTGTLSGQLYGPVMPIYGSCAVADWGGAPRVGGWSKRTSSDGSYTSSSLDIDEPGCYSWTAYWTADPGPVSGSSPINQSSETSIHLIPEIETHTSLAEVDTPGFVTDTIVWSGTLDQRGTVDGDLLGPVMPVNGSCEGVDWSAAGVVESIDTITTRGDGSATVRGIHAAAPGCYTWQVSWTADLNTQVQAVSPPGEASETGLVITPHVATQTSAQPVDVPGRVADTITWSGTLDQPGTISGQFLGPVPPEGGSCEAVEWSDAPVAGEFDPVATTGDGSVTVPAIETLSPGCYSWSVSWTADANDAVVAVSAAGVPAETSLHLAPEVHTRSAAQPLDNPGQIRDTITWSGTSGQPGTITGQLLGPVPPESGSCEAVEWSDAPVAGEFDPIATTGDGTADTSTLPATKPGCYSWSVSWTADANDAVRAVSAAGAASETSLHIAPKIATHTSAPKVGMTGLVADTITWSGTHGQVGRVDGQLLGPLSPSGGSCADLDWSGAAIAGYIPTTVTTGDGSTTVEGMPVTAPGCYTWSVSWTADANDAVFAVSLPGDPAETSLHLAPHVATQTSAQPVDAPGLVSDTIVWSGTFGQPGKVDGQFLGPVAPEGGSCQFLDWSDAPVVGDIEQVAATGDGSVTVAGQMAAAPGCYTWEVSWTADTDPSITAVSAAGDVDETSLHVAPKIATRTTAADVIDPGPVADRVTVAGTGKLSGRITGVLLGPVPAVDLSCVSVDWSSARPAGAIDAIGTGGDGVYDTNYVAVEDPGCYTWSVTWTADATGEVTAVSRPGDAAETFRVRASDEGKAEGGATDTWWTSTGTTITVTSGVPADPQGSSVWLWVTAAGLLCAAAAVAFVYRRRRRIS